jgi:hypothetical protein
VLGFLKRRKEKQMESAACSRCKAGQRTVGDADPLYAANLREHRVSRNPDSLAAFHPSSIAAAVREVLADNDGSEVLIMADQSLNMVLGHPSVIQALSMTGVPVRVLYSFGFDWRPLMAGLGARVSTAMMPDQVAEKLDLAVVVGSDKAVYSASPSKHQEWPGGIVSFVFPEFVERFRPKFDEVWGMSLCDRMRCGAPTDREVEAACRRLVQAQGEDPDGIVELASGREIPAWSLHEAAMRMALSRND